MYVNKNNRGATPAAPMPNVSAQTGRARTRAIFASTHTPLLETPRQPRPCQRLGTDGPALVQEPLWQSHPYLRSRRHTSPAHANVSAQTGPRSYKSHLVITHPTLLETPLQPTFRHRRARVRKRATTCLLLLSLDMCWHRFGCPCLCRVRFLISPVLSRCSLPSISTPRNFSIAVTRQGRPTTLPSSPTTRILLEKAGLRGSRRSKSGMCRRRCQTSELSPRRPRQDHPGPLGSFILSPSNLRRAHCPPARSRTLHLDFSECTSIAATAPKSSTMAI